MFSYILNKDDDEENNKNQEKSQHNEINKVREGDHAELRTVAGSHA